MTRDNPTRRSWQRETPLSDVQEVPKHQRRTKRPKPFGLRVTYRSFIVAGEPWVWTRWYETERARDSAVIAHEAASRSSTGLRPVSVEKVER